MKLDVGAGIFPTGDVNVDLLHLQKHRNFVKADAEHLPFRSHVFSECVSYHTIEHVKQPARMIQEMKRVVNGRITITLPLWFSFNYRFWLKRIHPYWFFPWWFKRQGFCTKVEVKLLPPYILNRKMPCLLPFFEIVAKCNT